jgi:hypothetical protein
MIDVGNTKGAAVMRRPRMIGALTVILAAGKQKAAARPLRSGLFLCDRAINSEQRQEQTNGDPIAQQQQI